MPKFRKKPVVVEAVQITRPMVVETLEGTMRGEPGDWLITGVKGEQYFCKDEIFKQTYEPVEEEQVTTHELKEALKELFRSGAIEIELVRDGPLYDGDSGCIELEVRIDGECVAKDRVFL